MKLHPLSVPYRIVQASPGLLGLLVVLAIVVEQLRPGLFAPLASILVVGGVALIVGWQVAYYRRFAYALTRDTFDISSGVIARRHREIPYRRIQNVDISRSLIQRMLGIAELRIETAGGSESEAHLRYVGYDEAKRLQEEVRSRTDGSRAPIADRTPVAGDRLYRITDRDMGVLAIASFDLRVASFLAVILSIVAPSVVIGLVLAAPVDPIVLVIAGALVVIILSAILSGGSAIINNFGFTLTRIGDELRYERGLLQRYDGSIPLDKVQTLVVGENVLMRWLGYASLTVETAGYAPGQGGAESAKAVPISTRERTLTIARQIEPFAEADLSRPARRARIRYTVQYVAMVAVLSVIAYAVATRTAFAFAWWIVPFTAILAPVAAHFKWSHRGYALTEEYAILRSGFWRRRTHVVPHYRIQTVDEVQSVLQRRWRIATVIVDTAGSSGLVAGHPTAYDLDQGEATDMRLRLSGALQESLVRRMREQRMRTAQFPSVSQGIRGSW